MTAAPAAFVVRNDDLAKLRAFDGVVDQLSELLSNMSEADVAALTGALHTYLQDRDSLVDELHIMVPFNLRPLDAPLPKESIELLACAAFVVAFVGALVHQQRYLPPFATDALTYHLPAAVQWLQTGRVGVFETWFFNPANTYSPLGGST